MKLFRDSILGMILFIMIPLAGWSQSMPARALDNVTIHTAEGKTIETGTIVWRNGIIEAIGSDVSIPFDAYVIDGGDSLYVYPGFIDGLALWASPDLPAKYSKPEAPGNPGYERAGIQPHRQPNKLLAKADSFKKARKHGFTTAALGLKGQMLPGQIDLFFVNGKDTGAYLIREGIGLSASFEQAPGSFGNGAYPATLMGVMARFRQLWYDAAALREQSAYYASVSSGYPVPARDEVLEALYPAMDKEQPLFFKADTKEHISRLFRLKDELDFNVVLVSGKEGFQQAEELRKRNIPVLASVDFPEEPGWRVKEREGEDEAEVTEEMRRFRERQLQAYQARITNIQRLIEAGVKVGYASNGMKIEDLKKHIQILMDEGGLSENQILAMLTQHTADILGIGDKTGDLKQGHVASFTVFTRPFTEAEAQALYSVSGGKLSEFEITTSEKEDKAE